MTTLQAHYNVVKSWKFCVVFEENYWDLKRSNTSRSAHKTTKHQYLLWQFISLFFFFHSHRHSAYIYKNKQIHFIVITNHLFSNASSALPRQYTIKEQLCSTARNFLHSCSIATDHSSWVLKNKKGNNIRNCKHTLEPQGDSTHPKTW